MEHGRRILGLFAALALPLVLVVPVVGFFAFSGAGPALAQSGLAQQWCGTERAADFTPGGFWQGDPQIKVVYAFAKDQAGEFQQYSDLIQQDVKAALELVGTESGGLRSIRFDLGTQCGPGYVDIASVPLKKASSDYLNMYGSIPRSEPGKTSRSEEIQTEVRAALGLGVGDTLGGGKRNFAVYVNIGPVDIDWAQARGDMPIDDQPGHGNLANKGGYWAWVWQELHQPWMRFAMLHEITHNLGAVQDSAPNSHEAHCTDGNGFDVMCPPFPRAGGLKIPPCYDCGKNDYFNVNPAAPNYLATHWNVANSVFTCLLCAPAWVWDGLGGADEDYHTFSAPSLRGARWAAVQGATGYEYAIGTTPGGTDVRSWTGNGVSTWVQLTNIAPTEGTTYYFSVRAYDAGGARSGVNTSDGITVDTLPPSSTVSQPAGAYVTSLAGGFSGTASDATPGSGVAKVRVNLRRDADWLYWDGLGWVGGYVPWLPASGTAAWSKTDALPSGADLPDGSYTVRSQAVDGAGLGEAPGAGKTIIVDSRPPSSAITDPTHGATVTVMNLQGTATDATSGVTTVEASLQNANGLYWGGSGWVSGEQWLAASGTTAWSLPAPPAVSVPDGAYTVRSRAIDAAGNVEVPAAGVPFTVDTTPPVISNLSAAPAFFSPNHDGVQDTTALAFTLSEAAPYVRVTILDHGGNLVHEWLRAGAKGANAQIWNGEVHVWAGVREGTYTYEVEAVDAAGNGTPLASGPPVVLDMTPPAVRLTGAGTCCMSAQPAGIGAEARDASGVAGVKFTYKLASDSSYTDLNGGTADTAPPYTLSWGSATLSHGASYDLRAVAIDSAGNSRASAAIRVTVNITPPVISNVSVSPDPFSPSYEIATFDYTLSEPATVWVRIEDPSGGKTALWEVGPLSQPAGPSTAAWDGRHAGGKILPDGTYDYAIEAVDVDGNVARHDGTVTVRENGV